MDLNIPDDVIKMIKSTRIKNSKIIMNDIILKLKDLCLRYIYRGN